MTPDDYCATETGGLGSTAYYSLMFATPAQRRAANAVLAFVRETRQLVHLNPDVAPSKFHWWREELQRCYAGAARHPITQALASTIARQRLEQTHLLRLLAAAETLCATAH